MEQKKNVALFISGGGTTAMAIMQAVATRQLTGARIVCVIANREDAGGLVHAQAMGVKTVVVPTRNRAGIRIGFSHILLAQCVIHEVDIILQCGWLPLTPDSFLRGFHDGGGTIINQHPGTLDTGRPDFGGHGMFGLNVFRVFDRFQQLAEHPLDGIEMTTHLVTEEYDRGGVIDREFVSHDFDEGPEDLQARALEAEHRLQVRALQSVVNGTHEVLVRDQPLIHECDEGALKRAKLEMLPERYHASI